MKGMLLYLAELGKVRKNDFLLFSSFFYHSDYGRNLARKSLRSLISQGLVEERSFRMKPNVNHREEWDTVLSLTEKGRDQSEKIPGRERLEKDLEKYQKRFRSRADENGILWETKKIQKELDQSSMALLFEAAGVPALDSHKVSLETLAFSLMGKDSTLSETKGRELLKNGIYYRMEEVLCYVKLLSKMEHCEALFTGDVLSGTNAKGVFLSQKSCFIVYEPTRFENKILPINLKAVGGMRNVVRSFGLFTEVGRNIPALDTLCYRENQSIGVERRYYNREYALIISDGTKAMVETAVGCPLGKLMSGNTGRGTAALEHSIESYPVWARKKHRNSFLTAESESFGKMYVVSRDQDGILDLQSLLHKSEEELYEEGCAALEREPAFQKTKALCAFPYKLSLNSSQKIHVLPVFEAKEIHKIRFESDFPVILTEHHLMEAIAKSIGRKALFYDLSERRFLSPDETYLYDPFGNILGESVLLKALSGEGKTYDKRLLHKTLPKIFNLPEKEFYNKVGRGEIGPQEVLSKVDPSAFSEVRPEFKKGRRQRVTFSCNKELKTELQKMSEEEKVPISEIIRRALDDKRYRGNIMKK